MIGRIDAVPYTRTNYTAPAEHGVIRYIERVPKERSIGKTVLALNGIFAGSHSMNPLARLIAEAGVVTVTAAASHYSEQTPLDLAILKQQMEDKFNQPVVLMGHSLGGVFMTETAAIAPENAELLLLQTAGFGGVQVRNTLASLAEGRASESSARHTMKLIADGARYGWNNFSKLGWLIGKAASMEGYDAALQLPGTMTKTAIEYPGDSLINGRASRPNLTSAGIAVHSLGIARAGHNAHIDSALTVADFTTIILNDGMNTSQNTPETELVA